MLPQAALALRKRGFKKRRNRFRRSDDAGRQVVDFQASQWGSRDEVGFTINLWVGVTELTEADTDSHVQQRVGALIEDGEDHWWAVEPDTDTARLKSRLSTLSADCWLARRSTRGTNRG